MRKHEVLSPVGDLKTFYTAIKSGCDAVYFGLPKFNARMRAENISLDNLPEIVKYAHLKSVKCYITLNTLLTTKEILEAVELVGKCLDAGVDAFIVQDMGLVYALKSAYPTINLHGSTQMGVHNARGARTLKNLGFSRVVLSRECTLEDIREIKNNVDIELEVFVQGAMCVAFSGNCYLSSVKCSASGNRGECKQLCRLPYTLEDNSKKIQGYTLSIRDNCMIDHLAELMDIGVTSFKIEGRLRHAGYVAVATSTYRQAVDSIISNTNIDYSALKTGLYKTFSRGEFIPGYNNGNNLIDVSNNNHLGLPIGEVISCTKFKDIYKITIKSSTELHAGDGIKFVDNEIISMGVGNVDINGKNQIVYGKNHIKTGSKVYLSLDSEFENSIGDYSRRRKIDIEFEGFVGNKSRLLLRAGNHTAEVYGDICSSAKTKPIDHETIIRQLTKWDNDIWELGEVDVQIEDIFLPLSQINDMRRRALEVLESKILLSDKVETTNQLPNIEITPMPYINMAIINEDFVNYKTLSSYDAIIVSPNLYSLSNINKVINKIRKVSNSDILINLPIISRTKDIHIIDDIVDNLKSKVSFIANNIYGIDYISQGAKIFAGSNLNIINDYSASHYLKLGVSGIIGSIEKCFQRLKGSYKYTGRPTLMTFAHCPYKTLYNNDCTECKCNDSLKLRDNKDAYNIRRIKIADCYFELVDSRPLPATGDNLVYDLRD